MKKLMKKLINYTKHNKKLKSVVRKLNFMLLQRIKIFRHLSIHYNYKFTLKDIDIMMIQNILDEEILKLNLKKNNLHLKKSEFLTED